jgi:hypothetical protein
VNATFTHKFVHACLPRGSSRTCSSRSRVRPASPRW